MRFSHDLAYDAPPEAVRAMLADPVFRERACEEMHASRRDVTVDDAPTGMTVVVDQPQPARGIPGFARRFVGDQIRIVQREAWSAPTTGRLSIEIPGKPGAFEGTVTLSADGDGTRETVAGEVTVKVPMIGGRLEQLVADLLTAALRAEHRAGRSYLAGR